jgi:hypothetical protein
MIQWTLPGTAARAGTEESQARVLEAAHGDLHAVERDGLHVLRRAAGDDRRDTGAAIGDITAKLVARSIDVGPDGLPQERAFPPRSRCPAG